MSLSLAGPSSDVSARPLAGHATAPTLGTANSFAVLAATAVTNVPTSTITGDVGLSPAAGSNYAGLTAAEVAGTIYAVDATGPAGSVNNPGLLTTAQADNTAAFGALIAAGNATCDTDYGAVVQDLVGLSLVPGVYCAGAFTLTGTLTLSGSGVWIFRSADTLITSGTANVVGGDSCSVWWRVPSSATIGTNTQLTGNILALTSIALQSGATLNGRALAQTGAVTLAANTINRGPLCTATVPTAVPTTRPRATKPAISGLPNTGGAPIRNEDFPWSLVVLGGFSAIALVLGARVYRRTRPPKQ
jgi:ice-binding like protein